MHQMAIDRRQMMSGLAATTLLPTARAQAYAATEALFAANVVERDGSCAAVAYSTQRGVLRKVPLVGRGHDMTFSQSAGLLVSFARRPGNFAIAFDHHGPRAPQTFVTPIDRHFYGHGVFSADGRLLYTTENDFESARGVIGIYDVATGFKRVGEFASHGLGPHDIALLSDKRTLVVANGGIETHPESGRQPLNLATMQSSLVYIDRQTGDLLERHELSGTRQKLSIRHLDVGANDTIVFGCQFKGPKWQVVDLVGFHRRGSAVVFLERSPAVSSALRHYVSSIAVDQDGEIAAVTSSRGQHAVLVDIRKRRVIGQSQVTDVSGVAAAKGGGFILTGGGGHWTASSHAPAALPQEPWSWDNHAVAINA